jgi:hypothetical protein
MADVDGFGQLIMRGGAVVPLSNTALTEGGFEEILTDVNFSGSAQNAGTFATQSLPSPIVVRAGITATTDMCAAYIRSAGKIKAALPVSGLACGDMPAPLPYPVRLVSGDSVMALANSTSDRECSVSVACTNGEYHVFTVTPTGAAAENEFVSVLTGQSVGQTLENRKISHAFGMQGFGALTISSPAYFLNGSGVPIGSITLNDPAVDTGTYLQANVRIALNTRLVVSTDA